VKYDELMPGSNPGITQKHLGINFWGETLKKQAFFVTDIEMEGLDCQVGFLLLHALLSDGF
jgi:hypothetical protein